MHLDPFAHMMKMAYQTSGSMAMHTNPGMGTPRRRKGSGGLSESKLETPSADDAFKVGNLVPLESQRSPGWLDKMEGAGRVLGLVGTAAGTAATLHGLYQHHRERKEQEEANRAYLDALAGQGGASPEPQPQQMQQPEPKISRLLPLHRVQDFMSGAGHAALDEFEDYQNRPQKKSPHLKEPPADPALK